MKIFSTVLENWTNYEIMMVAVSTFLFSAIGILSSWIFIKDKRSVLLSLTSSVSTLLIVILTILITSLLIPEISNVYSLVFLVTTTLSAINIMTLNNFLSKNRSKKDFDIDFVTREHFSDSLKLVSFICLFFSILIAFTNGEIRNILIASGISSVISISINHILSRIFFKDRNGK